MILQPAINTPTPSAYSILVFHGDETGGLAQPQTFRCCPLGTQLYSRRDIPLYELVEFILEMPGLPNSDLSPVSCVGIVAQCEFDPLWGLFRIWVKFLDLPDVARRRLHLLTQAMDHLCPFCANF